MLTHYYPDGNTESATYNSFSEPLTQVERAGNTTSFLYDSNGNATVIWDAANNRTTMTYTADGRSRQSRMRHDKVTTNQYDAQDRLTTITIQTARPKAGLRQQGKRGHGHRRAGQFHDFRLRRDEPRGRITDALGNRVTNVYDSRG